MNKKYINIAASILFLSLIGCTDDVKAPEEIVMGDENAITFSIYPESDGTGTRAYSTGSHIDQLIYKIYKKDNSGNFNEDIYYLSENDKYDNAGLTRVGVVDVTSFPCAIKLIPNPEDEPDQEYKIVLWAQKKDSEFFNLTKFPEISVNYTKADGSLYANNEELRDAFYCVETFTATPKSTVQTLVLKRPFAQINVGTSGWDYEGFASIEPNKKIIQYSKITINNVAKSFNALTNKASSDKENITSVTFDWAKIPAYGKVADADLGKLTGVRAKDTDTYKKDNIEYDGLFKTNDVEEFLYIKLIRPDLKEEGQNDDYEDSSVPSNYSYAKYIGWETYDGLCAKFSGDELIKEIYTETFKYLSMSYVLVPFNNEDEGSTVEVYFDCAENNEGVGIFGENSIVVELKNVPVGSNHRTNIIAADGTGFFMNSNEMRVKIYKETFADYYKRLAAQVKDWEEDSDAAKEKGEKENGENPNGKYEWPGGDDPDVNPDFGKHPYEGNWITLLNPTDTKLIDETNYIIHSIKYFRDNVKFTIQLSPDFQYEFYLWDDELDNTYYTHTGNNYEFTFTPDQLNAFREKYNLLKTHLPLEESETDYRADGKIYNKSVVVPDVTYYPFKLRVKPITTNTSYRYDEQEIMIRWYTAYKFTFSESSFDEGGEIISAINDPKVSGSLLGSSTNNAKKIADDEIGRYYITDLKSVESTHIKVVSRNNSSGEDAGWNDRIFAFPDHLRVRGAGSETAHQVILKNLKEDCKITVKWGRDKGQDNNGSNKAAGDTRTLTLKIGNQGKNLYSWPPYNWDSPYITPDTSASQTYLNNETKIYVEEPISISSGTEDVKIYVSGSGHVYYWILLSEPED